MKKLNLLLFLISSGILSFSQDIRLGICLNPNIGWITENVDFLEKNGTKTGIEGGLVIENYFSDNYALKTGLMLGTYGGKLFYNEPFYLESDSLINDIRYKLQYISVPVGLKLKTNEMGYFSWYALLGLTPQINISAKAELEGKIDDVNVNKTVSLFNLSYHFGGGAEYSIGGNTALTFGILFNNGFVDILKKQAEREKLSYLALQLGVMF